jgi:glycosyltransferase involved in cell wall biosynthesis
MIIDSVPKISCVMVTKGRQQMVERAMRCWAAQNYPNKELIVLSQSDWQLNHHVWKLSVAFSEQVDGIQFVEAPKDLSLGAMRNASIELATGDIICQWDDDDVYHPRRLMTQYQAIRSEDAIASMYTSFIKCFDVHGEPAKAYWTDWSQEHEYSHRFLCGSIMFFKYLFHEQKNLLYPETGDQCQVEEDLNVVEQLMIRGKIAGVGQGHQYVYVYHGDNTYDREHHDLGIDTSWKKTLRSSEEILKGRKEIEETFSEYQLCSWREPSEVRFLDADEKLAFTHSGE